MTSAGLRIIDLTSADLRIIDLTSADLRIIDLTSADLRIIDLTSADLRIIDFTSTVNNNNNLLTEKKEEKNHTQTPKRSVHARRINIQYTYIYIHTQHINADKVLVQDTDKCPVYIYTHTSAGKVLLQTRITIPFIIVLCATLLLKLYLRAFVTPVRRTTGTFCVHLCLSYR